MVQPDGKVLVGGGFENIGHERRYAITRLNADGSLDGTFDTGQTMQPKDFYASVNALTLQPDGKILMGGRFSLSYGGTRVSLARLNANGTVDTSFDPGTGVEGRFVYTVNALALQATGKVVLGGDFSLVGGMPRNNIAQVSSDGSADTGFPSDSGASDRVRAVAAQAHGKALVAGDFVAVNSVARNRIARLRTDGSTDTSFDPGTGADGTIHALAMQSDDKVILGGAFHTIDGTTRTCIARLSANGSLDAGFDPGSGVEDTEVPARAAVYGLAQQADGKVLLGGDFTRVDGVVRNRVARLTADGSLDPAFDPGSGADLAVCTLALQADGRVVIGGHFTKIGGTSRNRIARLNANGSLDTTFDPGSGVQGTNSYVSALAIQSDGKVLVGGQFSAIHLTNRNSIARLNADGSVDVTFSPGIESGDMLPAVPHVGSLALQSDGKVILGGMFATIDGSSRKCIARLNANGSLDTTFDLGAGADGEVDALALQTDGRVLVCGDFTTIKGMKRNHIARLSNPDGAQQALSVARGGGRATWTLRGSFPQPSRVLFEESVDGTSNTWSTLGWGVAVPGGDYQLTSLSLPLQVNHYLRATGWATGGAYSGSVSFFQSVLRFYADEPLRQYILTYTAGANGSIDGSTSVTQIVDSGSDGAPVTAVPNVGFHFVQWSDAHSENPRTDTNVTTSISVTANFAIKPTSTPTPSPTPTPEPTATPLPALNVTGLSPANYVVVGSDLQATRKVYVDRTFVFNNPIPASLLGRTYIRTAQAHKDLTSATLLSFDVNQAVTVFVALDERITTAPAWLKTWTKTTFRLVVSDGAGPGRKVYQKNYPKCRVTLGPNRTAEMPTGRSMYTVVIVPALTGTTDWEGYR